MAIGKWVTGIMLTGLAFAACPLKPVVFLGPSMEPTFQNHDVRLSLPAWGELRHGDVVVADAPNGRIVKRVALLPGDQYQQILVRGEWIDGIPFSRPIYPTGHTVESRMATVPAGVVYLLGDNERESVDSRTFGFVPLSKIKYRLIGVERIPLDTRRWTATLSSLNR